ncbi:helix-turn-helix domain-containing protein [Frankia sp. CNm7]|uniref:Helix-turn-helix domain-containing protein n=1 Tax=Frankia nepalensis TaxID=1836974 RepID=A0A937RLN6_9ACTN|nr:helix-turn-helix domain-containing protein [Frankia nepalensis]MBL7496166.1 helix-turn-helix domain-containing protein [Frankia nepalensis]MBL7508896.1 helix-turn-helix domain-containing protein [Frankia nepalensis]MBL7516736.1 helix-turn-helix domain-containing protein [Frankia nepalensis]MBL7628673.1 helix-turn-helix domain-containing protein [Frankia nepalensis]
MATSNPTVRVVSVLEVLIRHPHRGYGLSELARAAGVSKGTCLAIADTLVEHGYLVQHSTTRAYRLGPALITAGQAVLSGFVDLRPALGALARVTAEFDVSCSVLAVDNDQIVVLERVGNPDPTYGLSEVGARMPFAPPWGAPFVAWGSASDLDRWFGRSVVPLPEAAQDSLRRALRAGLRLGFFVTREIPPAHPVAADLHRLRSAAGTVDLAALRRLAAARLSAGGYFIDDLDPAQTYPVNHISVPVLGADGRAVASLLAMMFGRVVRGDEITRLGVRLTEVAADVAARVARPYPSPRSP